MEKGAAGVPFLMSLETSTLSHRRIQTLDHQILRRSSHPGDDMMEAFGMPITPRFGSSLGAWFKAPQL